jgi:hypothetical protein
MKLFLKSCLTAAVFLTAAAAQAWTYQDGDALLIFRASGANDVEFDLGPVTQFLNQPNGYTIPVTNWDLSLVTGVFGSDLTGVSIIIVATTPATNANRSAWLSSSIPNLTAREVTPSSWQSGLWSTIDAIGTRPVIYAVPVAGTSSYSIDPGGSYSIASYDTIVSQNGVNAQYIAQFGGNANFTVETVIPGSFYFWGIQPTTANPKPADSFVGSFSITSAGQLVFTAGPPAPSIEGLIYAPGNASISFDTVLGQNYWLTGTNVLGSPASQWPIVSGPIAGTGDVVTLNDTNINNASFYSVITP